MGFSQAGVITLYPEEAAFLVSRNALIVTDREGNTFQYQDFCEILCEGDDSWITFDKYQVYAYLKRLGYIVTRSKPSFNSIRAPPLQEENSGEISLWKLFFDKVSYWIYKENRPLVWNYKYSNYRKLSICSHL
jgi:hypothetical protein